MTAELWVRIVEAFTKLIGVVVWPAAALWALNHFSSSIRDLIPTIGEGSLEVFGNKLSFKKISDNTAGALAAAVVSHPAAGASKDIGQVARSAVALVSDFVTPRLIRRALHTRILWVDDQPDNNHYEIEALKTLRVQIDTVLSTEQALEKVKNTDYDIIISDFARHGDAQAAFTLLDKLKALRVPTPVLIYSGTSTDEQRRAARQRGAAQQTDSPTELFREIFALLH